MKPHTVAPSFYRTVQGCYAVLVGGAALWLAVVCFTHLPVLAALFGLAFALLFGALAFAPVLAFAALVMASALTISVRLWRVLRHRHLPL